MDLHLDQYERDLSILELAEALARAQELYRRATDKTGAGDCFNALFDVLEHAERCIFAHKDAFGVRSELFQRGFEEFVLLASATGMLALQQCRPQSMQPIADRSGAIKSRTDPPVSTENERKRRCGELLNRAEQHTRRSGYLHNVPGEHHASHRLELRLTALNNLACFHQRCGRPWAAIGFLESALRLQLKRQTHLDHNEGDQSDDSTTPRAIVSTANTHGVALTRLNLAAVLSQLERHTAAVEHAKAAVSELVRALDSAPKKTVAKKKNAHRPDALDEEFTDQTDESNAGLLVVAYYNLAVELEHTSDSEQAQTAFRHALDVAKQHPPLLRMDLVAAIECILHKYAITPRLASTSPRRGTPRGQWSPRSDGMGAKAASQQCPMSPRSLRKLSATQ